jgi:hypothetical protein
MKPKKGPVDKLFAELSALIEQSRQQVATPNEQNTEKGSSHPWRKD